MTPSNASSTTTNDPALDFSAPATAPIADAAAPAPESPQAADHAETAGTLTLAADFAIGGIFGPPPPETDSMPVGGLTQAERDALASATEKLCRKYDVGDIPYPEEIEFGMVAGSIILRRIKAKRSRNAGVLARQEEERQKYVAAQAREPQTGSPPRRFDPLA